MDTPPAVQAYVIISFVLFAAFCGLIFYLLTGLLTRQAQLKKARAQLQEYSANLEKMVAERTAQLLQSQKMAALGQLAAGVAHELNTPLGTIYNSSFYLKSELPEPSVKVQKHLALIENQVERCRKIIKDLLNFSRAPSTSLDLKRTDINQVLETCLSLVEKELNSGGIVVSKEFAELPEIIVDPSRLSQVFFNLILNAVQAMPTGGELSLYTQCQRNKPVLHKAKLDQETVTVTMKDTGVGIPSEDLDKLFIPFFTTKQNQGGVGLGLCVSYEIIKQFGGNIRVESKSGVGTTFTISLPLGR
jgi:two-component system NtrC family sensor kinase